MVEERRGLRASIKPTLPADPGQQAAAGTYPECREVRSRPKHPEVAFRPATYLFPLSPPLLPLVHIFGLPPLSGMPPTPGLTKD